jgi:hypothetical protein
MHTVQMACQRANENDRHNWNTMHGGGNVAPGWICDYYHIQRPVYLYNILKDNFIYVFTTTYAISAYHQVSCELKSRAWRGALDSTLCGQNYQWLAPGFLLVLWFPPPIKLTSTIWLKYCWKWLKYHNFIFSNKNIWYTRIYWLFRCFVHKYSSQSDNAYTTLNRNECQFHQYQ